MSYQYANPSLHSYSQFPNPIPSFLLHRRLSFPTKPSIYCSPLKFSGAARKLIFGLSAQATSGKEPLTSLQVVSASALLFFCLSFGVRPATSVPILPSVSADTQTVQEDGALNEDDHVDKNYDIVESYEDKELNAALESRKSKICALSVPLRIVALRGSVPPSWVKDFVQSQGRRLRFQTKFVGTLENIFSEVSISFHKSNVGPTSTVAADLVSIGDSWLSLAIKKAIVEPMRGVEDQDWFKGLSGKWKAYLRRNHMGEIDPEGEIWAVPYRWGTMVIAYKKSKFEKHKLAPIEDWADLWRPELAGRISMIDSPREIVGTVLKFMGASYNTKNINLEVSGGRNAAQHNLALLGKQVRIFDSAHYLKAFGVGDVWVAVGWSSDVIPVAKRMSNVAVIVPNSGTSLWADLWAIPAASRLETDQIGGRVRGPSPLIHQWIDFCLQAGRAMPFKQEVIPGAIPSDLESTSVEVPEEFIKGKPRLDSNLIAGVPPPEILDRCEFLEPLPDTALSDYKLLIASMQNSGPSLVNRIQHFIFSTIQTFWVKPHSKVT